MKGPALFNLRAGCLAIAALALFLPEWLVKWFALGVFALPAWMVWDLITS